MRVDRVIVDAGPLVAILNRLDSHHRECHEQGLELPHPFLTTWPVIAEAAWLLRKTPGGVSGLLKMVSEGLLVCYPLDFSRGAFCPFEVASVPGVATRVAHPEKWRRRESNKNNENRNDQSANELAFSFDTESILGPSAGVTECRDVSEEADNAPSPALDYIAPAGPHLPPHVRETIIVIGCALHTKAIARRSDSWKPISAAVAPTVD